MKTRWVPAILLTCLVVVGSTVHVAAESSGYEGTGASLKLGLGARAAGMADAFVSLADDAAAVYYNPAGLAYLTTSGLVSAYHVQSGIAGYFGIGYAKHNLGAAVLTLSSGDIQGTDEFGNPTEVFHASEGAILLAGAARFQGLALGITLKQYSQRFADVSGSGLTADVGALYVGNRVRLGAVGRNLAGGVGYSNGRYDAFERSFVAGVSTDVLQNFRVAADYESDGTTRVGAEYVLDNFTFRGGAMFRDGQACLTAGLGVRSGVFAFDYAYQTHEVLPDVHRLSLAIRF